MHKENNLNHKHNHKEQCGCHHHHDEGCGCHHHHDKSNRNVIAKIIVSSILLALGLIAPKFYELSSNAKLIIFLVSYLVISYDTIKETLEAISKKEIFNENLLMVIASLGAFFVSEYAEAVAVMLFFQIGELFEHIATDKSKKSIADLMDIRPDFAWIKQGLDYKKVNPKDINLGDIICIKPGERVPLDGVVINGESFLNEKQLTGEPKPRRVEIGNQILSGVINIESPIEIRVTKTHGDSTVTKILNLIENASSKKAPTENFIRKFAKVYTPLVVCLAILVAVIPGIITRDFNTWIYRGLTFLVVSCPCALVISIPLSFFAGIGASSKNGILVKGSGYLEKLTNIDTIAFDKTGTLTKGEFKVIEIKTLSDYSPEKLLEVAAHLESVSSHPIAKSLINEYGKKLNNGLVSRIKEISGKGISGYLESENKMYYVGSKKYFDDLNIKTCEVNKSGTTIYVACEKQLLGYILIGDEIKSESKSAVEELKKLGVNNTVMLTGDNENVANEVSNLIGIDSTYSKFLPSNKVEIIEKLITESHSKNEKNIVAFVGDGMNDAPVLARADLGISMGGVGSDSAIEASDIVIMDDKLTHISKGIKIARNTLRIVKENIVFSIGIKVLVLILAAFGFANMWMAVFADVGVMLIAVLNAMRVIVHK